MHFRNISGLASGVYSRARLPKRETPVDDLKKWLRGEMGNPAIDDTVHGKCEGKIRVLR